MLDLPNYILHTIKTIEFLLKNKLLSVIKQEKS